jgi:hypothetical protein
MPRFAAAAIAWPLCCLSSTAGFAPQRFRTREKRFTATARQQEHVVVVPDEDSRLWDAQQKPSSGIDEDFAPMLHPTVRSDDSQRRKLIGTIISTIAISASASPFVAPAMASIPEIDSSGNLFTPKADMLMGGSTAARGIPLARSSIQRSAGELQLQEGLYEPRFVTYLARFLLNYEPSAQAYWTSQGYGLSWDTSSSMSSSTMMNDSTNDQILFAAFAQSVEVGLADYFSGPFGSYSSVTAAVAGLSATQPAPSQKTRVDGVLRKANQTRRRLPWFLAFLESAPTTTPASALTAISKAKQGVLNLYSLLKARYNSDSAKRQLALLFTMISDPRLQPVSEIRQLLGEVDNCTLFAINLNNTEPTMNGKPLDAEAGFRYYSKYETPQIRIEPPAPLGDAYSPAKAVPIMKCTGRVLRIIVTDGGDGYDVSGDKDPPTVTLITGRALPKIAKAAAILTRSGQIESIVVLNPGEGYRRLPLVRIDGPTKKGGRVAKAYAELEYAVAGVSITDPGNGYVSNEAPEVDIEPPRIGLGDWVVFDSMERPRATTVLVFPDGTPAQPMVSTELSSQSIERIQRDPLALLPSTVRPEKVLRDGIVYYALGLDAAMFAEPQTNRALYRAFDPIFGGIGRVPVTVKASALTVSEYARLALSGAVCTVAVRTVLNPLELIKTKQQLQTDVELLDFANARIEKIVAETQQSTRGINNATTGQRLGTFDLIKAMVDLRGINSLFQSLDVTFLASLVFGSFGFGATELFRRSFAEHGDGSGSEFTLLLAASAATVLTAAAASPFEVLRVRSMGLVEAKPWKDVLQDFLVRSLTFLLRF